jgi:hypothetical protein
MSDPSPAKQSTNPPKVDNHIGRAVNALTRQFRQGLSPWVRRAFDRAQAEMTATLTSRSSTELGARRAMVSEHLTQTVSQRAQRFQERARVWEGINGPLAPARTDRFAENVVQRFPDRSAKYNFETRNTEDAPPLPLAQTIGAQSASAQEAPPFVPPPFFPPPVVEYTSPPQSEIMTQPVPETPAPRRVLRRISRVEEVGMRQSGAEPAVGLPVAQTTPAESPIENTESTEATFEADPSEPSLLNTEPKVAAHLPAQAAAADSAATREPTAEMLQRSVAPHLFDSVLEPPTQSPALSTAQPSAPAATARAIQEAIEALAAPPVRDIEARGAPPPVPRLTGTREEKSPTHASETASPSHVARAARENALTDLRPLTRRASRVDVEPSQPDMPRADEPVGLETPTSPVVAEIVASGPRIEHEGEWLMPESRLQAASHREAESAESAGAARPAVSEEAQPASVVESSHRDVKQAFEEEARDEATLPSSSDEAVTQRAREAELPLREMPRREEVTLPLVGNEAVAQRAREAELPLREMPRREEVTLPSSSDEAVTQRAREAELPLREMPRREEVTLPSSSDEAVTQRARDAELPLREMPRREEVTLPSSSDEAVMQRAREAELPLREMPRREDESHVVAREEVTLPSSNDEAVAQRTREAELPLREKSRREDESHVVARDEAVARRAREAELPLREKPRREDESHVVARDEAVARRAREAELPLREKPRREDESHVVARDEAVAQRAREAELPLREMPRRDEVTPPSVGEERMAQRAREAELSLREMPRRDEVTRAEVTPPSVGDEAVAQRAREAELPLREMPRREEVTLPSSNDEAVAQRTREAELPLREMPRRDEVTPPSVGEERMAQRAREAELPLREMPRRDEVTRAEVTPPSVGEEGMAQRAHEVELPLRERPRAATQTTAEPSEIGEAERAGPRVNVTSNAQHLAESLQAYREALARMPLTQRLLRVQPRHVEQPARMEHALMQRLKQTELMAQGWRFKTKAGETPVEAEAVQRAAEQLGSASDTGRALDGETRATLEPLLQRDLSEVRVHRAPSHAPLAVLNVEAATRGRDIFVEAGQERFDTPESLGLLGHEITHVAQRGLALRKPALPALPAAQDEMAQREAADDEIEAAQVEQETIRQLTVPTMRREPHGERAVMRRAQLPLMRPPVAQRQPTAEAMEDDTPPGMVTYTIPEVARMADETVMREELSSSTSTAQTPATLPTSVAAPAPDLDELARQVYPLLKRMLLVERERTTGWTR